ncbi:hypothetical protein [Nocardia sp. NPDC046763]|uniref:hypothetical protein n=1 Tax=Nocardia sp. NPDC046763 TaxID=3155256 RepID=UPI0033EFC539
MTGPTSITQGQIWIAVSPLTRQEATVVILDAVPAMLERQRVLAARVRPDREVPEAMKLLAVPVQETGLTVAVYDIAAFDKAWFTESKGRLSADEMSRVKAALNARFDL